MNGLALEKQFHIPIAILYPTWLILIILILLTKLPGMLYDIQQVFFQNLLSDVEVHWDHYYRDNYWIHSNWLHKSESKNYYNI